MVWRGDTHIKMNQAHRMIMKIELQFIAEHKRFIISIYCTNYAINSSLDEFNKSTNFSSTQIRISYMGLFSVKWIMQLVTEVNNLLPVTNLITFVYIGIFIATTVDCVPTGFVLLTRFTATCIPHDSKTNDTVFEKNGGFLVVRVVRSD